VVVGEPPTELVITGGDTVGRDGPTHHRVEVVAGHLGDRLDVAGVLGDERDHRRAAPAG
jgi:hypothetical protein